jgi:hypothetical protein
MEGYIQSFLLSISTALTLYLAKLILNLDKKVELLELEIKYLKEKSRNADI